MNVLKSSYNLYLKKNSEFGMKKNVSLTFLYDGYISSFLRAKKL